MPASSMSGLLSTSVYFAAVMLLMAVVMSPVASLYGVASLDAAGALAKGVATQIDDLSPGMVTSVEFGSFPGTHASVYLTGTNVTADVNGFSATSRVDVPLSSATLSSGVAYDVSIVDGVVTVA
jgi:hypothetical protein